MYINESFTFYVFSVRQLEKQKSNYEHGDLSIGTNNIDHHTSESDMTDGDDEQTVIETVSTVNNARKAPMNGRKFKTGNYNGKGGY